MLSENVGADCGWPICFLNFFNLFRWRYYFLACRIRSDREKLRLAKYVILMCQVEYDLIFNSLK